MVGRHPGCADASVRCATEGAQISCVTTVFETNRGPLSGNDVEAIDAWWHALELVRQ